MSTTIGRQLAMWSDAVVTTIVRSLRITPSSLVLRCVVFVAGGCALWLGLFAERATGPGWLVVIAGAGVAVGFPGSRYVLALELVAVLGWVVQTAGLSHPVTWGGLTLLAGALYLHHVGCAFAAQVPYDAIVPWSALVRWLLRAVAMIGASAMFAFGVVVLVPNVPAANTVLVPLLGFALIGALLGGLVLLYKRKGPPA
jgi:hypothetical protein